jgi:hypothetical protein
MIQAYFIMGIGYLKSLAQDLYAQLWSRVEGPQKLKMIKYDTIEDIQDQVDEILISFILECRHFVYQEGCDTILMETSNMLLENP